MIENQGQRPAELLVRGWMANLAAAPFQNDDEFRTAFAAGTCGAALVTLSGPDVPAATGTLAYYRPLPAVIDMEVLGILRHAEHPEAARLFAEWLVNEAEYPGKWRAEDADDLAPGTVSAVGWRTMDAVRLLERVGLN
jgi:iron(III) transport system substrate-binding protein